MYELHVRQTLTFYTYKMALSCVGDGFWNLEERMARHTIRLMKPTKQNRDFSDILIGLQSNITRSIFLWRIGLIRGSTRITLDGTRKSRSTI
jgi:hypothetical protein